MKLMNLALAALSTVALMAPAQSEVIPGEFLVKVRGQSLVAGFELQSMAGLRIESYHAPGRLFKVDVEPQFAAQTLTRLLNHANVEYVVPNIKIRSFLKSSDVVEATARLQSQWAIQKVNAERAWQMAGNKGNRNVVVAVIDTGADFNHSDLRPNMVPGYDFRNNDNSPMDETSGQNPGHGTHCAGIIGSSGLIDNGIVGLSPEVSMMPIRFLGADGSGDLDGAVKSIDYARENGAQIISASWGAAVPKAQAQPILDAIERADKAGITFIAAAANDGKNNDRTEVWPTNSGFPNTISVAASDQNDAKAGFSNFGLKTVHVAAPGVDILSTLPNNRYGKLSGTSMATPLVSGLAALMKAQDPSLTGAQLRAIMQTTGAKANIDVACKCRVDAAAAIDMVKSKKMYMVPAAATMAPGEKLQFAAQNAVGSVAFSVSGNIGQIAADGTFTASTVGEGVITAQDSRGTTVSSLGIRVVDASSQPPDNGGGECPLGNPQLCQIICGIDPTQPFCQ
jgi:thermitase